MTVCIRVRIVADEDPPQPVGREAEARLEHPLTQPAFHLIEPVPAVFERFLQRLRFDQQPTRIHALDVPQRDRVIGPLAALGGEAPASYP